MQVNIEWIKRTLANNVRFHRSELALSQKELAKQTVVSYRLIQDIEAGEGNPTMETLLKLARVFKITPERLQALCYLRFPQADTTFVERYKSVFETAAIAARLRNLNGVALWANKTVMEIHGTGSSETGPTDLLEYYAHDTRALLKTQMAAEKNGIAYPYTITYFNPKKDARVFIRCHPTLILPAKGKIPVYTSVYMTEIPDDCAANYYENCRLLLTVMYGPD